jgi:hypothetical protein
MVVDVASIRDGKVIMCKRAGGGVPRVLGQRPRYQIWSLARIFEIKR